MSPAGPASRVCRRCPCGDIRARRDRKERPNRRSGQPTSRGRPRPHPCPRACRPRPSPRAGPHPCPRAWRERSGPRGRPASPLGRLADTESGELGQCRRVLRVQPVGQLPEGHAAHAFLGADVLDGLLDGTHIRAAVPGLEVVADDQRGAVAVVRAVECLEQTVTHLVAPVLVLVRVALGRTGLVEHEVVVHREGLEVAARHRDELEREVPDAALLLWPDLVADAAGVVAEAHRPGCGDHVLLPFEAGGATADELLVVVEGQGRFRLELRGIGLPVLDEGLGLVDLALPLLHGPGPHPAVLAAEVAVEVGADLVAVLPGGTHLVEGVADSLGVVEADVGAAGRVLGRVVEGLLLLREQVHAAEEVGHAGVVPLGDTAEVREELLAVLPRTVPGEHHELRRLLTGRHPLGHRELRLDTGEGGRAVADELDRVLGGAARAFLLGFRGLLLGAGAGRPGTGVTGFRTGTARESRDQRRGREAHGDPFRGGHHPPTLFLAGYSRRSADKRGQSRTQPCKPQATGRMKRRLFT